MFLEDDKRVVTDKQELASSDESLLKAPFGLLELSAIWTKNEKKWWNQSFYTSVHLLIETLVDEIEPVVMERYEFE